MSGDFRQLLLVMENASSAKIINHTHKYSSVLWDEHVVTLRLRENMRVKNEMNKLPNETEYHKQLEDYEQWLLKLGEGRLPSAKTKERTCPDTDVIEIFHIICFESPKTRYLKNLLTTLRLILETRIIFNQGCS